jgi:cell division protein ZapA
MTETLEAPAELQTDAPPSSIEQIPSAHVEIYDQIYHLRGVDPVYITQLATIVDEKMRAVSEHGGTVDSLRVAVLAALNIADELTSLRQSYSELAGAQQNSQSSLRSRADSLSGMLDEVLSDRRVG